MPSDDEIMELPQKIIEEARKQLIREHGGMITTGGEVSGEWEDYLAEIPGIFRYFTEREPEDVDGLVEGLKAVSVTLGSEVTGRVDTVKGDLGDWTGSGAEAFGLYFLSPFEVMRQNQAHVVAELIITARAVREIIVRSREDILRLGNQTLSALEGLDDGDKNRMGKGAATVLAVAGAIVAVAATATGVGAPAGATIFMAVLGGGLSTGAAAWQDFGAYSVGGSSVADVLGSMNEAAQKLFAAIEAEEKHLGDCLRQDADTVAKALTPGNAYSLVPRQVEAVSSPDPATFHPGPLAM